MVGADGVLKEYFGAPANSVSYVRDFWRAKGAITMPLHDPDSDMSGSHLLRCTARTCYTEFSCLVLAVSQ